ncbi:hypothetical protein G3A_23345 [Bacillus sp. 17376]|nr:hypothetical protein G3A_23345 [Bacillus sp. 17376]
MTLTAGPIPAYNVHIEDDLLERRDIIVSMESIAVRPKFTEEVFGDETG